MPFVHFSQVRRCWLPRRFWFGGLVMLLATAQAAGSTPQPHHAPRWPGPADQVDRLIIRYRTVSVAAQQPQVVQKLGVMAVMPLTYRRALGGGAHVYQMARKMPVADARLVAQRVMREANVLDAEPDYVLHLDQAPNDPFYPQQWGLGSVGGGINIETAWAITQGDPKITVAVLDSGIRPEHVEFKGRLVPGYDFISDPQFAADGGGRDPDPTDPGDYCSDPLQWSDWHGTHVAGIIGAATNNRDGIAGVNPHSMILPVRTVGRCGGLMSDTIDGMRWAAGLAVPGVADNPHPARVLNLSLGAPGVACPGEFQQAIDDVRAHGALVVVSAGNSRVEASTQMPANCRGVIVVAAVDQRGNRADVKTADMDWGTNYGNAVSIAAPGVNILSTINTGVVGPGQDAYTAYDGTSMAAPHVTGILSLMLSINPKLTPDQATQLLLQARRPFAAGADCTGICAAGMADAGRAVQQVLAFTRTGSLKVFAGNSRAVTVGSKVFLHGGAQTATPIVFWSWRQVAGVPVTITNPNAPIATFLAPAAPGRLTFQLTARNQAGQSATAQVSIVGTPPPMSKPPASQPPAAPPTPAQPPVLAPPGTAAGITASAGSAQMVQPGALVVLNGGASVPSPALTRHYHWGQTSGAPVHLVDADQPFPSFIAPATSGVLAFRLTVTDSLGRSASAGTTVRVMPSWSVLLLGAPTVQIAGQPVVEPGAGIALRAVARPALLGQITGYHWMQLSGPAVTLQKVDASTLTVAAPALPPNLSAALVFAVTVTDTLGRDATAFMTVRVTTQEHK